MLRMPFMRKNNLSNTPFTARQEPSEQHWRACHNALKHPALRLQVQETVPRRPTHRPTGASAAAAGPRRCGAPPPFPQCCGAPAAGRCQGARTRTRTRGRGALPQGRPWESLSGRAPRHRRPSLLMPAHRHRNPHLHPSHGTPTCSSADARSQVGRMGRHKWSHIQPAGKPLL